jgi:hypothetical protein
MYSRMLVFGRTPKTLTAIVSGMTVALAPMQWSPAAAGDAIGRIEIEYQPCGDYVGLVTTDAMLSDVLQALAAELKFELNFKSDHDRPVSMELRLPARELIEALGQDDNIMITGEVDSRCDEPIDRLMTVWFLGTGPEITYQPAMAASLDSLPETGAPPVPEKTRSDSAKDDKNKEGEDQAKRKRDMTPEERYNERLRRKAEKGKY